MKYKIFLFALLFSMASVAQKGTITGIVSDKDLAGAPLPFANIIIKGTTTGTNSDENGEYRFSLTPGTYNIEYSFVGYESQQQQVTVAAGETVTVSKALGTGSYTLQDVVLQADRNREKASALLLEQKKAVEIKQSIGAQEMSRKGVSDAAAAVTKVTGISKRDGNGGIFVRGLGDRYNSTTWNGLPLPSNEPTNKNVALDIFSTDVIQSVGISKTYSADMYGDVGGANIDIVSKEHSGNKKLAVETGSGLNNKAFSSKFKVADGIKKTGFYNVFKPNNIAVYQFGSRWTPNRESNPADMNFGISGGNSFTIGSESKLSLFGTASFENSYGLKRGSQLNVGNTNDNIIEDFNDVDKYEYATKTTGMLNLGYKINQRHSLKFNSVFINSSKSEVDEYYFTNENGSESFTRQTITEQNKLLVNQLLGKNAINERLELNWGGSFSLIKSDLPDRITNTLVEGASGFVFNTNTQSTNNRYFQSLEENELAAKAVMTYKIFKTQDENYNGKLSFGYNGRIKSRDFEAIHGQETIR